jgi:SAM-dependent methyltransferase
MHIPANVTSCTACATLLLVAFGTLMAAGGEQDSIFSEAQAYERFMGRWSRSLAPLVVRFAGVRDGDTVLDVGSGTGALAAAVATIAPSSHIVGIDPAAAYVALAQSRHGGTRVRFEVGDAQQMRFENTTFDRTLSLLVLNFIPDVRRALGEMTRVTKPNGTIAAAVWDYGEGMDMLRAFWDEAAALTPAASAKDERNMPLCRRGDLGMLWREQGLQSVVEEAVTIETGFASFDDFWTPFLEKQGPAGAYAASLSPEALEALRARLRRRLLGAGPDKAVVLHARAWVVRGTKMSQ